MLKIAENRVENKSKLQLLSLLMIKDQAMSMIWVLLLTLVFVIFYVSNQWKSNNKKKLPPGPLGFPLLGSLHLLGKNPHHDFQKLSRKYGPIMHLRLGLIHTIVVSTPQAAELFLKTHDLVFASRPPLEAIRNITWEQKSVVFAQYGSYWRDMRKMCTLELLSNVKINSFMTMRREELGLLVEFFREAARVGDVVDLSAKTASLTADMTCRMVFGKKYSDMEFSERGFKAVIQEGLRLSAAPNVGDFIPFLAPFDIQGFAKRLKELRGTFDSFFDKIIDDHLCSKHEEGKTKDFVDVMLSFMGSQQSEYQIEKDNIKALMLDMLTASMDTSATAVEWTMSELIKNPRTLKTLQKELETVVGLNKMVEESDLENLKYLDMVVNESFRLHPVAPLLIHHSAYEDCTVNGFHIPRKSRVFVNVYAIGRDPDVWNDPETFYPERFIGSNVDVRGKDFQLIPFGAGRRGCPGLQLGLIVVKLCVAQFVHCFDWNLPDGMSCLDLDMEEEISFVTPRANPLLIVPSYRLHK